MARGLVLWGVSIGIGVVGMAAAALCAWLWRMPWSLTDQFAGIWPQTTSSPEPWPLAGRVT